VYLFHDALVSFAERREIRMNRAEFIERLTACLGDVPQTEREEAVQYYKDYFDDAGAENEAGVIASLGTPEELAKAIQAGLADGGNVGEFTEAGFQSYGESHKNAVADSSYTQKTNYGQNAGTYNGQSSGYYGQNVGNSGEQGSPYGQSNGYYDQNAQTQPNGSAQKKKLSGGRIALIVIAAILTSPVWISILTGLFGLAVGIVATLFGILVAVLGVGLGFAVAGFLVLCAGVVALFAAPISGVCLIGSGMVVFAIGLVFIWLLVFLAGAVLPRLIRGVVKLCRRLFHRGGVQA
jgi:uncharacterized membrane protein